MSAVPLETVHVDEESGEIQEPRVVLMLHLSAAECEEEDWQALGSKQQCSVTVVTVEEEE